MLLPPIGLGHSFVVFPIGVFHDCADMDESGTLVRVSHEVVEMDARAHFDSEHDECHGAFGLESLREGSLVHALDAQQQCEHEDDTTSYEHRDQMDQDPWGAEAPQTQVISPVFQEKHDDQECTAESGETQGQKKEGVDLLEGPKFTKTPTLAAAKKSATWQRDQRDMDEEYDQAVPTREPEAETMSPRQTRMAREESIVAERVAKMNRDIEEHSRLRRLGLVTPDRRSREQSDISSLTSPSRTVEEPNEGNPRSFYYGTPDRPDGWSRGRRSSSRASSRQSSHRSVSSATRRAQEEEMRELRAQMEALQNERQVIGQQAADNQRMAVYLENQIESQREMKAEIKAAGDARYERCKAELHASFHAQLAEEAKKIREHQRSEDARVIESLQAHNDGMKNEQSAVLLEVERLRQTVAMQQELARQEVSLAESRAGTATAERTLQANALMEDKARAAEAKASDMARRLEFAEQTQRLQIEKTEANSELRIKEVNESWTRKMKERSRDNNRLLEEDRPQSVEANEAAVEAKGTGISEGIMKPLQTFRNFFKTPIVGDIRPPRDPEAQSAPATQQGQQRTGEPLPEPAARPESKGKGLSQGPTRSVPPPPGGGNDPGRNAADGVRKMPPKCYLCVQNAIERCPECQRLACNQHYDKLAMLCIECAAKAARKQKHMDQSGRLSEADARAIEAAVNNVKSENSGAASSRDGRPCGVHTPPRQSQRYLEDRGGKEAYQRDELQRAPPPDQAEDHGRERDYSPDEPDDDSQASTPREPQDAPDPNGGEPQRGPAPTGGGAPPPSGPPPGGTGGGDSYTWNHAHFHMNGGNGGAPPPDDPGDQRRGMMGAPPGPGGGPPDDPWTGGGGLPPNSTNIMFTQGEKFALPFFPKVAEFRDWVTNVAYKVRSLSSDPMAIDWVLAPTRDGAEREEFVEINPKFWKLDDRLAIAFHEHCMTIRSSSKYDDFLRELSSKILNHADFKMWDGEQGKKMSGLEMMWMVCDHYTVRGRLTKQYAITDLMAIQMTGNKEAMFHKWYQLWLAQYHRLPAEQKKANMGILVEQVVNNAKRVSRFAITIDHFQIWKQDNPGVTDERAMDWLKQRFALMNEITRGEYTLEKTQKALRDALKGNGGGDSDRDCRHFMRGHCKNGTSCAFKHDYDKLKKKQRNQSPKNAAPAPHANAAPAPTKGRPKGDHKDKNKGKGDQKGKPKPTAAKDRSQTPSRKTPCFAFSRGHCTSGAQCHFLHESLNAEQKKARDKWEQERVKTGKPLPGYGPNAKGIPGWSYKPGTDAAPAPTGKGRKPSKSPGRNSNGSGKAKDKKDPSKTLCKFYKTKEGCRNGDACKFKHARPEKDGCADGTGAHPSFSSQACLNLQASPFLQPSLVL